MLLPSSRWVVHEPNQKLANELAQKMKIAPIVATLLVNRGMITEEKAISFLHAENEDFHDPFLFQDMGKTVDRIQQAIDRQEPILIFGDYDADGVTSTTVLTETLLQMGANVTYYIPNRFTEGYGPNKDALQKAYTNGIQLIITVDTGIAAIEEAKFAKEIGIDFIITDHHEAGNELPEAFSIIHPKIPGSIYPFKDLAGVGVAFKLAHALSGHLPEYLLDLAAIGTIADLVPLHGENRIIVKRGLKILASTPRLGLRELCEMAGTMISEVNEETVGFRIGPRLNAPGRLEHAGPAVELLKTKSPAEAKVLAEEIDRMNKERQMIVSNIADEAIQMVEQDFLSEENKVIVIGKSGWNPGVIGIVASRLVEKFYRPTIILSFDHETGLAKGSARSINGFNLFENLSSSSDILPHFGGHAMAAGMTLSIDHVDLLRHRLNEAANEQLEASDFIPITELDAAISLEEIDVESISQLNQLAPYGMGNPKPQILIEHVKVTNIKKIGANKNHLRMTLAQGDHLLDGIGFQLGRMASDISPGSTASVIGELSINEWNNKKKPQIFLKDVAIKEWQLFDLRGNRQFHQWTPYLREKNGLFVFFSEKAFVKYGSDVESVWITNQDEAKKLNINGRHIILFDLPPQSDWLEILVKDKSPASIYAHFLQEEEHFFATIPTRNHFKWYYAFLLKRGTFDLKKYGADLAIHRGWSKETISFMSKVFFELDFVTIKEGRITMNIKKTKRDLEDSPTYQRKQQQIKTEKELTYSTYDQLKKWFDEKISHSVPSEEEQAYGSKTIYNHCT
ncbi:single-stranded-DNA-specific exonuclease RecJ [Lederbergia sp. NSJ-179]|uniref:single-stranded-DNA-specific exonuclease RecJ n=1 Tax=Lederbergia sp. NSJ-179 TaxID=2931402 RepID=UPI001FD04531|nr:single-stranded-DNA-specific exonuclease RecJ [Lederbergia sp. NSJ-179]MCJ7839928.1 single-stranded-DNA-specific exonuclease RecJ [Lederbergia sp. NSJ-179]